jgi:hypothetical protein
VNKPIRPASGRSKIISARVDAETYDGYRRCLEQDGQTVSASIRDAIECAIENAQRREIGELQVPDELHVADVLPDDRGAAAIETDVEAPDDDDGLAVQVVGGLAVGGFIAALLGFFR